MPLAIAEQELEQAREAALDLLSRREHSRRDLARKLRRRGVSRELVEAVLNRLEGAGLVSDERYARLFVADRLAVNPAGRRRLVQSLRRKGIAAELAARAVDEVYGEREVDEAGLAEILARRRANSMGALDPRAARRRLAGYLARRGFRSDVVTAAVAAALGPSPEGASGRPWPEAGGASDSEPEILPDPDRCF